MHCIYFVIMAAAVATSLAIYGRIALAPTGIVPGQVIGRVCGLAKNYAARLEANKGGDL